MSLWQFSAAMGGYAKANGAGGDKLDEAAAAGLGDFLLSAT